MTIFSLYTLSLGNLIYFFINCLPTRNKHHAGMDVFMFSAVFPKPGTVANTYQTQ